MEIRNDLSLNVSILYRSTQRYFDLIFAKYGIGYAQLLFLTMIYENKGILMNELALIGSFDKGTVTKSLQKLEASGYINISADSKDKRIKAIYISDNGRQIINELFIAKQNWFKIISSSMNDREKEEFLSLMNKASICARRLEHSTENSFFPKFFGLDKLSFDSYNGYVMVKLYTGGCNMRCPFCFRRKFVFLNENEKAIEENELFAYLNLRKDFLDGICIDGGEPTLDPNLPNFLLYIKENYNFKIKLNTNGSNFKMLKDLIDDKLIDYVALDIKNINAKYAQTAGLNIIALNDINNSIDYLLKDVIDYEFTTTLVKEFHTVDDIIEIAKSINKSKRYYLQKFHDDGDNIEQGLHAFEDEEMLSIQKEIKKYIKNTYIR